VDEPVRDRRRKLPHPIALGLPAGGGRLPVQGAAAAVLGVRGGAGSVLGVHERTFAVAGRRVKLTERGRGQAVVLLHGLTGSRAYLRPYAERLGRTHRVVAVDLPGHGGSDLLEPFSFPEAARVK